MKRNKPIALYFTMTTLSAIFSLETTAYELMEKKENGVQIYSPPVRVISSVIASHVSCITPLSLPRSHAVLLTSAKCPPYPNAPTYVRRDVSTPWYISIFDQATNECLTYSPALRKSHPYETSATLKPCTQGSGQIFHISYHLEGYQISYINNEQRMCLTVQEKRLKFFSKLKKKITAFDFLPCSESGTYFQEIPRVISEGKKMPIQTRITPHR